MVQSGRILTTDMHGNLKNSQANLTRLGFTTSGESQLSNLTKTDFITSGKSMSPNIRAKQGKFKPLSSTTRVSINSGELTALDGKSKRVWDVKLVITYKDILHKPTNGR